MLAAAETDDPRTGLALLTPPRALHAPGPVLSRALAIFWILLALVAVVSQAGTSWRVYLYHQVTSPAFASLGYAVGDVDTAVWDISPQVEGSAAEVTEPYKVLAINGAALPEGGSAEAAAAQVAGPDGGHVTLELESYTDDSAGTITVTRSAEQRAAILSGQNRTTALVMQIIDNLMALLMLVVAAVLFVRRRSDPVAIFLSFTLLVIGSVGNEVFWEWLGLPGAAAVIDPVWMSLLLIAIPAFPDGRYVPSGSRWLIVAAPVVAAATVVAQLDDEVSMESFLMLRALLVIAALLCVIVRFRRTPAGRERQQMKWVSLGLGIGLFMYALSEAANYAWMWLPEGQPYDLLQYVSYGLDRAAYVAMAAGLLVSLLGFRLNDADGAIGRSAGYAAITTLIGIILAISTMWLNRLIGELTGSGNPALSTAISTMVALAVVAPLRTRVMTWTEAKFQRALVGLRGLPKRLTRWQHDDDPKELAQRALAAVVKGVDAKCAALIDGEDQEGAAILAAFGSDAEAIAAQLGERRPAERRQDDFPLRIPIQDEIGLMATLLLGRRSDGASYSKEERAAVSAITDPLADALRRAERNAEIKNQLTEVRTRLIEVEAAARGPAPLAAT